MVVKIGEQKIIDPDRCSGECDEMTCRYVCPAGLFTVIDGKITFNLHGFCLECGACRLVCDNISFHYPSAGEGIIHRFG
ncbi:MAG: hypothetical protein CVU89_02475 [Firmicutes bacterium HGW-Firmicutes-14]|nr:MAG: hypothetical protein CVU89_02475 [Firmicutes bacterium HGW-Firmicutes-14]